MKVYDKCNELAREIKESNEYKEYKKLKQELFSNLELKAQVEEFERIRYEEQLLAMQGEKQSAEIADERRSQVGTGDRSERIRTYNFPQGRVSDHRIGLTLYRIEAIMNGDLDEIIDALITADTADKLKVSEE